MSLHARPLAALALALSCILVPAAPAFACGGLFCSRQPVDQAGEKIIFMQDGDDVIAHVQIQYQGDAKDFSWIVPTPTPPTLSVGSDSLFTELRLVTKPQFTLNYTTSGTCKEPNNLFTRGAAVNKAVSAPGSVEVISQNRVGPFDSAVIQSDDASALKKWLTDHDYVIPPKLDPLLNPYVAGKYSFVALRLSKDASVGDIQPIVLKYKATKPGIPIRLTGVAATPDMGVYVWVMGDHRAIPENYRHAIINETRIDWQTGGQNYAKVVTDAMNEAGGQAFVTDYAGKQANLTSSFNAAGIDKARLQTLTDPAMYYREANRQITQATNQPSSSVLAPLFRKHFPKPTSLSNVDDITFYNNFADYADQLDASAKAGFDPVATTKDFDTSFVQPLAELQAQAAKHPYLTQLYTTLSPEEMTQDPTFLFNSELPEVSNLHTAQAIRKCSSSVNFFTAPLQIVLADGTKFYATNTTQGGSPLALPAAARIEQLKPQGAASVIKDNHSAILQAVAAVGNNGVGFDATTGSAVSVPRASSGFGCMGCSSTNTPLPPVQQGADEGLTYALLAFGALGYRRYKGRQR